MVNFLKHLYLYKYDDLFREYMHQNKKEHIPNNASSLLIVCNELDMILNSFKHMDQTKPLTILSQNK